MESSTAVCSKLHTFADCRFWQEGSLIDLGRSASDESGEQRDERVFQWFGASYQDLTQGISFLKAWRADVVKNAGLHLDDWKERIIKGFGVGFYDDLKDWTRMSIDAILLAEQLVRHANTFGTGLSAARQRSASAPQQPSPFAPEQVSEGVEMIADPRQKWQMLVNLVDVQIEHLVNLRQVYAQLQAREQVHTCEFRKF